MKQIILLITIFIGISLQGMAQKHKQKNKDTEINLKTELDTINYCLGLNIGSTVKSQGLEEVDVDLINRGILAGMGKDSSIINEKDAAVIINSFFKKKYMDKLKKKDMESQKWLEANKTKEGIITTESGLQYKILRNGDGATPKATDKVKVHYHGTLTDGTVFDSSVDRGEPIEFPVNGVIKGWQEALQLMKVGCKWRLFIPPALGYGERGAGDLIGPNVVLIFDVELLDIVSQ